MSDLRDAAAVVTGLRAAYDLSKAFLDVRSAVSEQAKVFELQRVILAAQADALTAQAAQSALLSRVSELEKRVAELEAWDREKERYEPTEIASGVIAYALKAEAKGTGPDVRLCATCFDDGHKSTLQSETRMPGLTLVAVCNRCGANHYLRGNHWVDQPHSSGSARPRRR